jgi:hypothetical protein
MSSRGQTDTKGPWKEICEYLPGYSFDSVVYSFSPNKV